MTYLKRWCLLPLSGLLILAIVPTVPEVMDSISMCPNYFLEGTPPEIPGILEGGIILDQTRYKTICQTYDNTRRFVTLYDTVNRIPVFSAYKYRGTVKGKRPDSPWKIEPQLEGKGNINMEKSKSVIYKHQASNEDYKSNSKVYNRGHLFPSSHAFDESDKVSTFTLTNIVPQAVSFNGGSWARMESCVQCVMEKYCINSNGVIEGFVVTGAKPSNNNILNKRINIPEILWTAFCCYSSKVNKWLASAHWGDNIADDSKSKYLQTKTLEQLNQRLSLEGFKVFPEAMCAKYETGTEYYPEINAENQNCNCPPQVPTTSPPSIVLVTDDPNSSSSTPSFSASSLTCYLCSYMLFIYSW